MDEPLSNTMPYSHYHCMPSISTAPLLRRAPPRHSYPFSSTLSQAPPPTDLSCSRTKSSRVGRSCCTWQTADRPRRIQSGRRGSKVGTATLVSIRGGQSWRVWRWQPGQPRARIVPLRVDQQPRAPRRQCGRGQAID